MKARRTKDGTFTLSGVDEVTLAALTHIAGDLGEGNAVLRFSPRYEKWARPNKAARELLAAFADVIPGEVTDWGSEGEWDELFDRIEKPKFKALR